MKNFYIKTIASLAIIGTMLLGVSQVDAQKKGFFQEEVDCSNYSQYSDIDVNKDQCFIGETLYASDKWSIPYMADYFTNNNEFDVAFFDKTKLGPGFTHKFTLRQDNVDFMVSPKTGMFKYAGHFTNQNINGNNYKAQIIPAKAQKVLIAETEDGSYLSVHRVGKNTNKDLPVLSLTYTTRVFAMLKRPDGTYNFTSPSVHKEHIFFKAAWCGDGVVQSDRGEKFDDGDKNGQEGYASLDCTKKTEPNTPPVNGVCDGASAGIPTNKAPTTNLCKTGTPSIVMEHNNKFTWTCGGLNQGTNATCEAPKKVDPLPPPPPEVGKCDQTFSDKIRVGYRYGFPDFYNNNNSYPHTLNSFNVYFKESHDMNGDGSLTYDKFQWASPIKSGYQIPAGAKDLRIIEANPTYRLHIAPAKRQKDNIYIEYTINSTSQGGGGNHKECISYEVTWCGDGILDADEGEKCDPNDPTKKGWGPGGCNPQGTIDENGKDISCQPKQSSSDLSIKKYVGNKDGQTSSDALNVDYGAKFTYKYTVTGTKNQKNVTVTDKFPLGVKVTGFNSLPNGWSCKNGQVTDNGKIHHTVICHTSHLTNSPIDIIVNAEMVSEDEFKKLNLPADVFTKGLRNIAYVCSEEVKSIDPITGNSQVKVCEPGCTDPNNPSCLPPPPPPECSDIPGHPNYDPACVIPKDPTNLSIKKYVGNKDGQTSSDALNVDYGAKFTYKYTVTGTKNQKNVTVTDKFPLGVKVTGFNSLPNGWSCKNGQVTDNGKIHHTVICHTSHLTNSPIDIIVNAEMVSEDEFKKLNLPADVFTKGLRNIAYVCSEEVKSIDPITGNSQVKVCEPGCTDPNNPSCLPPPPPPECSDIPGHPNYDPACVIPGNTLDLSIKKYVDSDDAQPNSPVEKKNDSTFNYIIKVKVESGTAKGLTTVKDLLPEKIISTGNATGDGWNCAYSGKTLICTSTREITTRNYFPDIIVPVKLTNASSDETIRNDATVHNPNEKPNSCYKDNRMPNGNEQSCENDSKNTDPAVVKTPGSVTGGSVNAVMCVNDIAFIKYYSNRTACEEALSGISDPKKKQGCFTSGEKTQNQLEEIRKDIEPQCKSTTTWTPPYCGDGLLQAGEQCDPGTGRGLNGKAKGPSSTCSETCQLTSIITDPGENPINFFISIPTFAKTAIGGSRTNDKPFSGNGMIIGKGTNIFALSDEVILKMEPKYRVPIQIESDRRFAIISGDSNIVEGGVAESGIDDNNTPSHTYHGKTYYVYGEGDLLVHSDASVRNLHCDTPGRQYKRCYAKNTNEVSLFKGSELTGFKGVANGDANIILAIKQQNSPYYTDLASFPVKVISSKVSTTGSSVSRQLATFKKFENATRNFLKNVSDTTSTTTETNSNNGSFPFGTNTSPLNANISKDCLEIRNTNDLEKFKHNGNSNVYACKGDLKISTDLQMQGVKTILVQGNIIIDSNINYKSGDNNASWAFIAKGGDIKIANKVTNISGVFASLKETNGGNITGLENKATSNILTIDGTIYGNAQELFNKRTYARASNSYDILTTGTVLNYSNRALRNPPPLLSDYLNHYKVQRVVR